MHDYIYYPAIHQPLCVTYIIRIWENNIQHTHSHTHRRQKNIAILRLVIGEVLIVRLAPTLLHFQTCNKKRLLTWNILTPCQKISENFHGNRNRMGNFLLCSIFSASTLFRLYILYVDVVYNSWIMPFLEQ